MEGKHIFYWMFLDSPFLRLTTFIPRLRLNSLPAYLVNHSSFLFVNLPLFLSIAVHTLVVERRNKFFRIQIRTWVDSVSVDRLKPVISDSPVTAATSPLRISDSPVTAATSPLRGCPPLCTCKKKKSVRFLTQSETVSRQNPYRQVRGRSSCSALTPPYHLVGVMGRKTIPRISREHYAVERLNQYSWTKYIHVFSVYNI